MGKKTTMWLTVFIAGSPLLSSCDFSPETAQKRMHLPAADFQASAIAGRQVFAAKCASCHGEKGRGTEQGPPLVHPVYRPGHHADLAFHMAVSNGARQHHWRFGDMPSVPGVSPEDVGHVIAFIRLEQRRVGIK